MFDVINHGEDGTGFLSRTKTSGMFRFSRHDPNEPNDGTMHFVSQSNRGDVNIIRMTIERSDEFSVLNGTKIVVIHGPEYEISVFGELVEHFWEDALIDDVIDCSNIGSAGIRGRDYPLSGFMSLFLI